MAKFLSVPEQHQFKIAKSTLKMSEIGARIMGGMTKDEARKFLREKAGWSEQDIVKFEYQPGDRVHIDTDHEEWGRVASDATIIEIQKDGLLVNAESIRANIIVPFTDVAEIRA